MSSQKITSKNLTYDSTLPPFLAALRAQASGAQDPDPILSNQRRSVKKRSGSEEAEDAPLVVDDEGQAVEGVTVDKHGTVTEASKNEDGDSKDTEATEDKKKDGEGEDEKVSFGARKRRIGKVIGGDDEPPAKSKQTEKMPDEKDKEKKVKKKTKKIKLSFDEDEA